VIAFAVTALLLLLAGFALVPESDPGPSRGRWPTSLIVAVVVAGLALLVIGFFWLVAIGGFQCNDGDGGVPYTARDSLLKDYCNTGAYSIALGLPLVPLGIGAVLTARRGRWRPFVVGLIAGALMANSPMLASAALPSSCSDEAERNARAENRPERCEQY
jgi:hypothetical protein